MNLKPDDKKNVQFEQIINLKGGNKSAIGKHLGGVSGQLIGQYISGRQKPKEDFFVKWQSAYNEDIRGIFKTNVSLETNKIAHQPVKSEDHELSLKAIVNLTETNQVLANNSSRLITLLEQQANSNSARQVPDVAELIAPVIQMMAKAGVPDKWKSVDDGIVELGKLMVVGAQVSSV